MRARPTGWNTLFLLYFCYRIFLHLLSACLAPQLLQYFFLGWFLFNSFEDVCPVLFQDFCFLGEKNPFTRLGSLLGVWQRSRRFVASLLQCTLLWPHIPRAQPWHLVCRRGTVGVVSGRMTSLPVAYDRSLSFIFSVFTYLPNCVCLSAPVSAETPPNLIDLLCNWTDQNPDLFFLLLILI